MDPTFRRPDAVVELPREVRRDRVKEDDDLCVILPESAGEGRFFVRCVLEVQVHDRDASMRWGLWAEISEPDMMTIVDTWDDPTQDRLPEMDATIANDLPGYPSTLGLPAKLALTGPSTRPALTIAAHSMHPFAVEMRQGVLVHRVDQWLRSMR